MVLSDHSGPVHCNGIAFSGFEVKPFDVSLYGYCMDQLSHWLNDGFIQHWLVLTNNIVSFVSFPENLQIFFLSLHLNWELTHQPSVELQDFLKSFFYLQYL